MIDVMLWPALLSLSFGGVIGIISQIQHSRCSEIRCCGIYCKRNVPNDFEATEKVKPINENEIVARIVNTQE